MENREDADEDDSDDPASEEPVTVMKTEDYKVINNWH